MKREQLRNLIRESIQEVLTTKPSLGTQRDQLKGLIKKVIKEVMQTKKDKKTKEDDSYDPLDIKDRTRQEKERPQGKAYDQIFDALEKVGKSIDKDVIVVFDDHGDFNVERPQAFRVRVSPRWENNFDVEAMIEGNDRIKIIGLTLDQVVDFIKANFTDEVKDVVKKSYDKAVDQTKDVADDPKPDIDSTKGIKQYKPEKKTQNMVKNDEDLPGAPMKKVDSDDVKRQKDHSGNQVKPPKHKNDKELVKRMSGKKK